MFDPVSGKPKGVPYEPYWRCQRCGICVLESHEGPVVCGRAGDPPTVVGRGFRPCPMEYVTPTTHCPIVIEPKPSYSEMLGIVAVVVIVVLFVIFG